MHSTVTGPVVRLHQAYEGKDACMWCGAKLPWADLERCPRPLLHPPMPDPDAPPPYPPPKASRLILARDG